jgi:hypothetical protein
MRTAIQTQEKWALRAISNFHTGSQKSSTESIFELKMRGPDVEVRNRSKQLFRITHGEADVVFEIPLQAVQNAAPHRKAMAPPAKRLLCPFLCPSCLETEPVRESAGDQACAFVQAGRPRRSMVSFWQGCVKGDIGAGIRTIDATDERPLRWCTSRARNPCRLRRHSRTCDRCCELGPAEQAARPGR